MSVFNKSFGAVAAATRRLIAAAVLGGMVLGAAAPGHATSITGSLTADNAFFAYLSTDDTQRGTLVASGNNWGATFSFSNIALTAGTDYFLHVEAINYGGPGALIGSFSLSDTGFTFANGTQSLLTDTTNWKVQFASFQNSVTQQPWIQPTGADTLISLGVNGVGPWGFRSGISGAAQWIWGDDAATQCALNNGNCTVMFSTKITAANATVPAPAALALFGLGLVALGAMRRKAA